MLGTRMVVAMANRNRNREVSQRLNWDFWSSDPFFRSSSRWGTIIEIFCDIGDTETAVNLRASTLHLMCALSMQVGEQM